MKILAGKPTKGEISVQFSSKKNLRQVLRWVWIYFLYYSGLIVWANRRIAAFGGVLVLTFHRVLDETALEATNSPEGMIVRKSTFESLLQFVRKRCEVLPLTGQAPSWDRNTSRARFILTFDDGWKDTAEVAAPLAEKYSTPITVFVCPGLAGQVSPFWPETVVGAWHAASQRDDLSLRYVQICQSHGLGALFSPATADNSVLEKLLVQLKSLPPDGRNQIVKDLANLTDGLPFGRIDATMSWEDTLRIVGQGVKIGSHTQSHQILTTLSIEGAQKELVEAKRSIEMHLNGPCTLFAYPNGSWSLPVRELVKEAGYSQAFANAPGIWNAQTDALLIPRINIWEGSLTGPSGKFSSAVFQYTTIWRGYRALQRNKKTHEGSSR